MGSSSIDLKPAMAATTIGKNESKKTIRTFGVNPNPNQMMNRGATAIFGTICRKTMIG